MNCSEKNYIADLERSTQAKNIQDTILSTKLLWVTEVKNNIVYIRNRTARYLKNDTQSKYI